MSNRKAIYIAYKTETECLAINRNRNGNFFLSATVLIISVADVKISFNIST